MCHTIIQQKIDGSAKLQAQAQPMEFVQPQYVPKNYASCASYCSIFTMVHLIKFDFDTIDKASFVHFH